MSNRKITQDGKLFIQVKEMINTPNKWCKYRAYSMNAMCIKGALWKITKDVSFYTKLEKLARSKVGRIRGDKCAIVTFNDARTTTHQDVMNLLDEAISKEIGNE